MAAKRYVSLSPQGTQRVWTAHAPTNSYPPQSFTHCALCIWCLPPPSPPPSARRTSSWGRTSRSLGSRARFRGRRFLIAKQLRRGFHCRTQYAIARIYNICMGFGMGYNIFCSTTNLPYATPLSQDGLLLLGGMRHIIRVHSSIFYVDMWQCPGWRWAGSCDGTALTSFSVLTRLQRCGGKYSSLVSCQ